MASVLLIETDAPLVRLMSWFLLEAGYEVSKAEGLEVARDMAGQLPVVIVFNSGLTADAKAAAILELRGISPRTRFLDISQAVPALGSERDTGADAYMNLPFDADSLVSCVRELEERASARRGTL